MKKKEWRNLPVGPESVISISIMEDRTLLLQPSGKYGIGDLQGFYRERGRVIEETIGPDRRFIEIWDLAGVRKHRGRFALFFALKQLFDDHKRTAGIITVNAPIIIKYIQKIIQLIGRPFRLQLNVVSLQKGIEASSVFFHRNKKAQTSRRYKVNSSPGWSFKDGNFSAGFEVIDDNILHCTVSGLFEHRYIKPLFKLQGDIIRTMTFPADGFYYILDLTKVLGIDYRTRDKFLAGVLDGYRLQPLKLAVAYGAGRSLGAALYSAYPFLPFPIKISRNREHALELIEEDMKNAAGGVEGDEAGRPPLAAGLIEKYVHDLLNFIGRINWYGPDGRHEAYPAVDPEHPFANVMDVIALAKSDLDEISSERNQAIEELKESENRLRQVLTFAPAGIFTYGVAENRLVEVNEAMIQLTGYSRDELLSMKPRELISGDSQDAYRKRYKKMLMLEKVPENLEVKLKKKDDSEIWVFVNSRMNLKEGAVQSVTSVVFDITRHKNDEKALLKSNRELRMLNQVSQVLNSSLNPEKILSLMINEVLAWTDSDGCFIWLRDDGGDFTCPQAAGRYSDRIKNTSIYPSNGIIGWVVENAAALNVPDVKNDQRNSYELASLTGDGDFSLLSIPLIVKRRVIGVLQILAEGKNRFSDRHTALLEPLAASAAIAIENARLMSETRKEIQERKQTEIALRLSEERFRSTFLAGPDAIDITRLRDGVIVDVNDGFTRLTGYTRQDVIGVSSNELDIWRSKEDRRMMVRLLETAGEARNLEINFRSKNGSLIYGLVSSSIVIINGEPHIQSVTRDITELKRAEREAGRQERKYREILENISEGYFELNPSGEIVFTNDSMADLFGFSKEELLGMAFSDLVSENEVDVARNALDEILDTGVPVKAVGVDVRRKDDSKIYIETSLNLLHDQDGKPIGFSGIMRDLTERKKAEFLKQEKLAAEAASKAKSEFLANMSHEIRTPINGIIGMSELALHSTVDDRLGEILETINREAVALTGLINDILDFSKIEAQKLVLDEISFNLRYLIEDVAKSISYGTDRKGLEFISYLAPEAPSRLIGDPGRLRQILVNLAGNAVKFTDQGEIFIKVDLAEDLGDKVKLIFFIKDTGIGIPKEKQGVIFDMFTQADGSTTRNYGGTGLGTTIARQLVEKMDGKIWLESEEGKGTTFWFTAVFKKDAEPIRMYDLSAASLEGLKILVVDDNDTYRAILSDYLKNWGCIPFEAENAQIALDFLMHDQNDPEKIDLIITDIHMSIMDGFEFAGHIRKNEYSKKTPIIALASVGRIGDAKLCGEIGIEGYLTKPLRRDDLQKAIRAVMGLSDGADSSAGGKLVTRHTITEAERKDFQILVVEDYPVNQDVVLEHLQSAGYQVDLADNGHEAVVAFSRKHYDLILMDLQMPVLDGYEAARAIRDISRKKQLPIVAEGAKDRHTPIIAMTANVMKDAREKCIEAGMDDYIAKPLKRNVLLSMVEKWFKVSSGDTERDFDASGIAAAIELAESMPLHAADGLDYSHRQDSPMNFDQALEEFMGKKETLIKVLKKFLGNVEAGIKVIDSAITEQDVEKIAREAHAIRGGASNLIADGLAKKAFELEQISKTGNLDGASEVFNRLKYELEMLRNYTDGMLESDENRQ